MDRKRARKGDTDSDDEPSSAVENEGLLARSEEEDSDDDGGADDNVDGDSAEENDDDDGSDDEKAPKKKAPAAAKKPAAKKAPAKKAAPKKVPAKKESAKAVPEKAAPVAKKAAAAKPEAKRAKKSEGDAGSTPAAAATQRRSKEVKPVDMIESAMKSYKWWEAAVLPKDVKWRTLEHCGVLFPPTYVPHGVKMRYDGVELDLTPEQEELAGFYASNPKMAKVYNANFFRDFRAALGPGTHVTKLELCDFGPMRAYFDAQRAAKKELPAATKAAAKAEKDATLLQAGFALVDGHLEKMGNYNVEPPGLFKGRGEHPKMGVLKRRVLPEDITLNLGADAPVPPCTIPGHHWKRVVHDPSVTWLAFWRETVMNGTKYVQLAASSSFKGKSDLKKYEVARKLKKHIAAIRAHYEKLLASSDAFDRQSGTAMWIIDRLALRVGGEKDEDEADTVGCCSLRVEHLKFGAPDSTAVTLDFLGKDSMQFLQTIEFAQHGAVGLMVLANLRGFVKGKKYDDELFSELTPARLNEQLSALMPGLSAKVFRTYNASVTLEAELEELPIDAKESDKKMEYDRANREVAILCNHQRTVPKAFFVAQEASRRKEALLIAQLIELKDMSERVAKGKSVARLRSDDARKGDALWSGMDAAAKREYAKRVKDGAEPTADDLLITTANDEEHLFEKAPDAAAVKKRIAAYEAKLEKLQAEMKLKDSNKDVALGTSKINYMDPRITVAWCKRVQLPIERVFAKTLQNKFPWAMGVTSTFKF